MRSPERSSFKVALTAETVATNHRCESLLPCRAVAVIPTPEAARAFLDRSEFVWHQRFELAPGVWTPGVSPVPWLCNAAGLPADLSGVTVLDVGTTNAGTAFELERRGAARVVAVDIFDPDWFGVRALTEFLESNVEYVRASVYELAERFAEPFDLVIFWGVLYHLRHPLLALDNLRKVTRGEASLETAVCDAELPRRQRAALARPLLSSRRARAGPVQLVRSNR